jgi:hypothetical protein
MIDYSTKKQFVMKEKDTMIELTAEMKAAALKAERDFEAGKCFSETDFKEKVRKMALRDVSVKERRILSNIFT